MTKCEITAANVKASHIVLGEIKIDLRTGEVYIPEHMDVSEASLQFWKALAIHGKNSFES